MNTYAIVGAGGLGRDVMPSAREIVARRHPAGDFELVFVDRKTQPAIVNGHRVMTDEAFLALAGARHFCPAVADTESRKDIAQRFHAAGAQPFSVVAANVIVQDDVEIGAGSIVLPFSFISSNVRIGRYFVAHVHDMIAHDSVIGDFVTLAPRVNINGSIIIEDDVYIGTGAMFLQGTLQSPRKIGRGAQIGMGSIITHDVGPGVSVVGGRVRSNGR